MAAQYAIWREDAPAGVTGFRSEAEALAAVRRAVAQHGAAAVSQWALVRIPARGNWKTVAEGTDLVERAQRADATEPDTGTASRRRTRATAIAEERSSY